MDMRTTYLGMELKNPVVASSSPLSQNVDTVKQLEDNGAAAVVMYSLFEEQIDHDQHALDAFLAQGSESFAEALSYFPHPEEFPNLHAEEYLEQIARLKKSVEIPVIASLNGVSSGGWMEYATKMEEAGADALELNVYYIPTDPFMDGAAVEAMYLEDLKAVKSRVKIPVAVKVGPYFSAFANMAKKLDEAGADGLVLFNRFYQPDLDLEQLAVVPNLEFSLHRELRLPLRWLAILYGNVNASLAATSGIHHGGDLLKAVMAGADVTMMASALLERGPAHVATVLGEAAQWMEEKEYASIAQMKGSVSSKNVAEPAAFERANYMKTLQSLN